MIVIALLFMLCEADAKLVVVDAAGHPVGGASVAFTAEAWDSTIVVDTEANGSTTIPCVQRGEYIVTVSKPGHITFHGPAARLRAAGDEV